MEKEENPIITDNIINSHPDEKHCVCSICRSIWWNIETQICNKCEYEWY